MSIQAWLFGSLLAGIKKQLRMIEMEKVTAGKDKLGDFAPKFAELNDDVLFGQVWVREDK